jgi:hypothetical protein
MRTAEEQNALDTIQAMIRPHVGKYVDEVCANLSGKSEGEVDGELRRIGHVLFQLMKHTGPELGEAVQIGLPFAFIEMARECIASWREIEAAGAFGRA